MMTRTRLAALALAANAAPAHAAIVNQWVQFAPDDTVVCNMASNRLARCVVRLDPRSMACTP